MRRQLGRRRILSEGERARALAFLLVGFSSAALGYLAVLHLDRAALFDELSSYQCWIVLASGLGGMVALFLSGDRMGQAGWIGALRAVAGAIWLTFVGALVGGTLCLPFYGTMFGPFIVMVTFMGAPVLTFLWLFNLVGIHVLLGIYQRERDSIFRPPKGAVIDDPAHLKYAIHRRFV